MGLTKPEACAPGGGSGPLRLDAARRSPLRGNLPASAWSVADQAAVSLGTFLTSVALARSLSPADYGVYAAIVAALLFFNGIHGSLVTSPLTVQGAAAGREALTRHATASLLMTLALAAPASLVLIVVFGELGGRPVWIWAPAALAAWQAQETMRRSLMCGLNHRRAVWGDAISYLGQAAIVWWGARAGSLTLGRALAAMALTSAAAAAVQAAQTGLATIRLAEVKALAREHWKFGSWLLYGTFASVFTVQAFFWVLAWSRGPREAASLQAVWNIVGVCHPLMFGLGNLLVPAVARTVASEGLDSAWRAALRHGAQFGAPLAAYFAVLLVWPQPVLGLLYGAASPYLALAGALRLMAAAYALTYLAQVLGQFLAGIGDSRANFRVQVAGAAASVAVGLPLAAQFGVTGAGVGVVAVNAARLAAGVACARRLWRAAQAPSSPVEAAWTAASQASAAIERR